MPGRTAGRAHGRTRGRTSSGAPPEAPSEAQREARGRFPPETAPATLSVAGEVFRRGASRSSERQIAIAAEFDRAARSWETGRLAPWYRAQGELVMSAAGALENGRILDVGCATGWLLRQLVGSRPGLDGVGVDLSETMVRVARAKAAEAAIPNVTFRRADWEAMPLDVLDVHREKPIRLVTCVSAFHYFRAPLPALKRMRRMLAPGGRLLLLDRDKERAPLTAALDLAHRHLIRDHCVFYRGSELSSLLARAGFEDVQVESKVRRYFWHGKALSSLVLLSARNPETQVRAARRPEALAGEPR